jgi:hypothetical protein
VLVSHAFTVAWTIVLSAAVAVEAAALANKQPGDTLSEHVWRWFSIKEQGRAWRVRRFALLAGLAWLAAHLLTGGAF